MDITATKIVTFDAAHMLSQHEGLCNNLHGHTYKLEITICYFSEEGEYNLIEFGSSEGMVVDFKDLKNIVQKEILDKYDHAFICWTRGDKLELDLGKLLIDNNKRVVYMSSRPTAENMAIEFFRLIHFKLPQNYMVSAVKVWETPTSYAEVRGL